MTNLGLLTRVSLFGITIAAIVACGGGGGDSGDAKRVLSSAAQVAATSATAIAAGYAHTCALTNTGGVKCWGANGSGQLGDGTGVGRLTSADVVGLSSGVTAIAAGSGHTCALTSGGAVKCWGAGGLGQLGDSTTTNRPTPVDVVGLSSGVAAIAAGGWHTCALTNAGGLKCWGRSNEGQLGDGVGTQRSVPVDVVGLGSGVVAVAGGGYHTCALTAGGGAKCWGANNYGQIGRGSTGSPMTPVDVVGLSIGTTAISAGAEHTCALKGGGVKCWGRGDALGNGTTTDQLTPSDVAGLSAGVAAIDAGGWHTCALMSGGSVKCWGWNAGGQLGDGTATDRLTPVDVVGFTANEATNLENPHPGAHVSGIGLVSGWTCMSGVVEVSFDGGPRDNLVPSGGGRGDTLPVCGRTNTGFGLLFNYNLLGSGNHTVELFINGVQVGSSVPFTVTVPVGEFIRGAAKTVDATDFPSTGRTTRLEWQESTQNFAITGVR